MTTSTIGEPDNAGIRAANSTDALSIEKRQDGVFVLRMNVPNEPVNTLKASFAEEFEKAFAEIEQDSACKAVVFTSSKKSGFIAGADISMLKAVRTENDASELARIGQRAMDRIEAFRVPVVAAIHGAALGLSCARGER